MRLGVVGTGFAEQHLNWMQATSKLEPAVLCYGLDEQRAAGLAKQFGIADISADAVQTARTAVLDAIVIVSPPDTHEAIARAALERGLAVICDKPLSTSVAGAARMADLASAQGHPGLVLFQWRLHPLFARLRQALAEGRLGRPLHASFAFRHDFLAGEETHWPWRHAFATSGGGALGDMGVHLFDLVRFLMPGRWAVDGAFGGRAWRTRTYRGNDLACETDDFADVHLRDADGGGVAAVSVSRVATGLREIRAELCGSEGSATLLINPVDAAGRLTIFRRGSDEAETRHSDGTEFNPYASLQEACRTGGSCGFATFADGLCAQQLLEQAVARMRGDQGFD